MTLNEIISKVSSNKLKERIQEEYNIIGEENLNNLLTIHEILKDNYNYYSLSGSINSFYICHVLNIISIDPVSLDIKYSKKFNYSINIPLNQKDNLVTLLQNKINYIKKVSNANTKDNNSYTGIIIDSKNELITYNTEIVKLNKKDLIKKYSIINIYEKEILTLLEKMNYGNEEIPKGFYYLNYHNKIPYKTKDKTVFESITKNIKGNTLNLKELVHNTSIFNIYHLDYIILEKNLTIIKYTVPRVYYITYLEYLSSKIDIKIFHKYQDNFTNFFKENKDELTYEYKFYSLWYDFTKINKKANDLTIFEKDNKLIIKSQNIIEIHPKTITETFNKILDIINETNSFNKNLTIFGYKGDFTYYLSNLISVYSNISHLEANLLINPLCGVKGLFNLKETIITEKQYKSIQEFIIYLSSTPCLLNTEKCDLEDIFSITNYGTEEIIIEDIEELESISKHTKEEILNTLNKLNKRIYIFHKIERS